MQLKIRKRGANDMMLLRSALLIVFAAFFAIDSSVFIAAGIVIIGLFFVLYNWIIATRIRRAIEARRLALSIASTAKNMTQMYIDPSSTLLNLAEDTRKYRKPMTTNGYRATDWAYTEFSFEEYGRSKTGTYTRATYHFAVAQFELPRKLPNVFFDSKQSGAKEFSLLFSASQKHSLESNFDTFFTAYFHEDYTLDSLSFITPEVMEALITAKEYDIEINGDKLFLISELKNMPEQLEEMERLGKTIREKLLNNILTYRDERLSYEQGRQSVSIMGATLKRSITKYIYGIVSGVALLVLWLVVVLTSGTVVGQLQLFIFIFGFSAVFRNANKIRKIKVLERSAKQLSKTAL